MNVSIDETRQNKMDLDGDVFSERTGGGYDVTLTLPNGQVTTFAFNYDGPTALGGYLPTWEPAPGVTATLTLQSEDQYDVLQTIETGLTGGTIPPFWSRDPDTPWGSFDFSGFVLKTVDGTQYYINRQDLGDHTLLDGGEGADVQAWGDCFLSYIKERNGDLITINSDSIVFTATNGVSKEIAITRNSDNLITSISDPNGINTPGSPPSLVYQYDNQDNLIAVEQLVNAANSTYVTNTFSYTNSVFPHYITGIINANGTQVAKNFYDDSGKLIAVQDANGNLTQFFNTPSNSMEVVIDRMGNTNSCVYDSRGNIILETNALGQITTMAYDANNNTTNEIMYLNGAPYSTNSYFYDTNYNVMLSSTDPLGHTNTYQYDTNTDLLISTDARGYSTTNTYDANGNLVSSRDATGDTTTNIYAGDLLTASIDPIGTMTTNTYGPNDNLIASATVGASGILSSNTFTYDDNGNRLSSTVWRRLANGSWEGDTTSNIYDAMNRVVQTINPNGGSSSSIYTSTGQQQSTTDANTNTTSYGYDDENRIIVTTNADGTTTSSGYDNNGNRITSTDQEGRMTQYRYDGLNRLTNTIYPDGATSATVYDALGRVAETVDACGVVTAFEYDTAGRKIAVTNAVGTAVQSTNIYTYDQNGNQITFTDANNHSTTKVYDALNRQVQVQYQDGTASETVYDADGRSIAQTNQDKIVTLFGYDGAGRLVAVTNALGQVTQYRYDEAGNEIAQIDALGRKNTYAYDSMGRKVLHTLPGLSAGQSAQNQTEGWTYDFNGNQITYTNRSGAVIYSVYDEMNRLTNYYDGDSEFDYDYTYTPTGQRASMAESIDSGIATTYTYDIRDRLSNKSMIWDNMSETLAYSYDPNGNVTSIASAYAKGVHLAYSYDPLNRLTNVLSLGQPAAAYSYDLAGNLKGMTYGNGVTNQYKYDSLNSLTNLVWGSSVSSLASFAYKLMNGEREQIWLR
jgi:YD repeat-containing protein